jgi:hypothetical protein
MHVVKAVHLHIDESRTNHGKITIASMVAKRNNQPVISHVDSGGTVKDCSVKELLTSDLK